MMHIDASAIVAILANEADRKELLGKLDRAEHRSTSAVSVFEAALALARATGSSVSALSEVNRFLEIASVDVEVVDASILPEATIARDLYGKGTGRRARLNMGDCFSYAFAKRAGVPLLCKGSDFIHTDLAIA